MYTWQQAWDEYPESIRRYIIITREAMLASIRIGDANGAAKYFRLAATQASNHSYKLRNSWV